MQTKKCGFKHRERWFNNMIGKWKRQLEGRKPAAAEECVAMRREAELWNTGKQLFLTSWRFKTLAPLQKRGYNNNDIMQQQQTDSNQNRQQPKSIIKAAPAVFVLYTRATLRLGESNVQDKEWHHLFSHKQQQQ